MVHACVLNKVHMDSGPQWMSTWTNLDADNNDKGCRSSYSKGLIVCEWDAVALRGMKQYSIRNEEQNHRGVDSLCNADEKLSFIKQQVQLAGLVQFWIL